MEIFGIGFAAFFALVVAIWHRFGGFVNLVPVRSERGGEPVVFLSGRGPYQKSGRLMDQVYDELVHHHATGTTRGFGLYYDDPETTKAAERRYDAGCLIDTGPVPDSLQDDERLLKGKLPFGPCVEIRFPYRGKLSALIGALRCYPALAAYLGSNGLQGSGPAAEIYDIPGGNITYRKYFDEVQAPQPLPAVDDRKDASGYSLSL